MPLCPPVKPGNLRCDDCDRMVTVRHWYASGQPKCWKRQWTKARLWKLMGMIERGLTDGQIASTLGTTADAVMLARKRNGIGCRRHTLLSARTVAAMLGIGCAKAVARWIDHGWLKGRRGQLWGAHRQWYVRFDDLLSFLDDEAHWHRWHAERITHAFLRQYALRRRGHVRFLTVGEVADRYAVQPTTVYQWIRKGSLPAVRNGNHLIRESDLDAFQLPRIGGRRSAA